MKTFEESTILGSDGIDLSTSTTGLARVVSRNSDNSYTFTNSLIFDEGLQLVERPVADKSIHGLSTILASDSPQFLHYDTVSSIEWFNNCFADMVINISLKPFLSTRKSFQMSLGRSSAFGLKSSTQLLKPLNLWIDRFEELPLGCDGNFVYSDIDSDNLAVVTERPVEIDIFGNSYMYKHPSLLINKYISRTNLPIEILSEVFGNLNWYFNTPFNSCQTNHVWFEPETTSIISDSKKLSEDRFFIPSKILFKDFTSLISRTANKLSRKVAVLTDRVIGLMVKPNFIRSLEFKSPINNLLSRFGVLSHCFKKCLIEWYLNLHRSNCFHTYLKLKGIFKGLVCALPALPVELNGMISLRRLL